MPETIYIHPTGYKIRLEKHPGAPSWRLVGTRAEGTFCHKPCTVSGGGKSEISKSIAGSVVYGPIYIADWEKDLDQVEEILKKDYSTRFLPVPELQQTRFSTASQPGAIIGIGHQDVHPVAR